MRFSMSSLSLPFFIIAFNEPGITDHLTFVSVCFLIALDCVKLKAV